MPKQQGGVPPFTDNEALHRRLVQDWIDGDAVDPSAIEFAKCSVERGAYATPVEALSRGTQFDIAVGSAEFGRLPSRFDPPPSTSNPPPKSYELVVVHCPENGNQAHTHLQSHQVDEPEPREPSKTMKQRIRSEIASTMKVTYRKPK